MRGWAENRITHFPDQLSGGEMQRFTISPDTSCDSDSTLAKAASLIYEKRVQV
jgi:predicted ABC-type transport system involved in lysophospholipase L1 biosynthesis ATPase subunit